VTDLSKPVLKRAARGSLKMLDAKNRQKFVICAPSHNFVGQDLRNEGTYRQSNKSLLRINISSTCPHNIYSYFHVVYFLFFCRLCFTTIEWF